MKRILYLSVLSFLIFSCSSSKKFDYANAYQFSIYKTSKKESKKLNDPVLIASKSAVVGHLPTVPERLPLVQAQAGVNKLTKKEKQAFVKEVKQIRKDFKNLSKIDPARAEIEAQNATKALTGKIYAGTVIGIAGLILMILGVASPLGAIAFVAGLVLIVWGLLEQGSF